MIGGLQNKSPKILENDIRHMASLSLCIFFPECSAKYSVTWFDHHDLWIEIVFDETFSVCNFFFIWPQHYDIFLYLVEMPKIPNFLHLQVQISSGALRVSKFWSRERRLFAWQIKPHNFYLETVYIAHREVKDLPRF